MVRTPLSALSPRDISLNPFFIRSMVRTYAKEDIDDLEMS